MNQEESVICKLKLALSTPCLFIGAGLVLLTLCILAATSGNTDTTIEFISQTLLYISTLSLPLFSQFFICYKIKKFYYTRQMLRCQHYILLMFYLGCIIKYISSAETLFEALFWIFIVYTLPIWCSLAIYRATSRQELWNINAPQIQSKWLIFGFYTKKDCNCHQSIFDIVIIIFSWIHVISMSIIAYLALNFNMGEKFMNI